jgi:hypothetical protein
MLAATPKTTPITTAMASVLMRCPMVTASTALNAIAMAARNRLAVILLLLESRVLLLPAQAR